MAGLDAAYACPCAEVKVPEEAQKEIDFKKGLSYSYTPAFRKDFNAAISSAKAAVSKHIGERNIAIISDIDETLLDNREDYAKHEKFTWDEFTQWIEDAHAPLLKPTADLLAWARKKGVVIILLTGRQEKLRRATMENLVRNQVAYDALYMRPNGDHSSAIDFKSGVRKQVEAMGFKIILNIGDQYSDLLGGYSENCEKLPNRIYWVK